MEIINNNKNNKQINITFNLNDEKEKELYEFIKALPNKSGILKDLASEYKLKEQNKELYMKNIIKQYIGMKEFNNNLKGTLKQNEMQDFLRNMVAEMVESELKNIKKLLK